MRFQDDCPHCGAHGAVPRRPLKPLIAALAWVVAFGTIFCFALTTVVLLMIAPLLFLIVFGLIGGVHAWFGEADVCAACGKLCVDAPTLERLGAVRIELDAAGFERERPIPSPAAPRSRAV